MNAVVISIGSELINGQCLDTNAAWLSTELTRVGVGVVRHETVGDDVSAIESAARRAIGDATLVVVTGGLGPTPDDVTRQAIADALGVPLEENAEALAQIRAFFERLRRPMRDANRVQALVPRGCTVVPNAWGTAPGFAWTGGERRLFALPGVPSEMKAMFTEQILPTIPAMTGGVVICERRLLCFGIGEAALGETIADLMDRGRNPQVGTTASHAVLSVRIVARGRNEAEARRLADQDVGAVRQRLGPAVFGENDDTLQSAVGRILISQGKTVSTAESCTGGLLAKRLTDVPGSSAYFSRGVVAYSNEAKQSLLGVPGVMLSEHGAVSEPVVRAMALGCRVASRSDLALAVTGIAGPGGGNPPEKPVGLVYIALAWADGVEARAIRFGEHLTREEIRDRACKTALNMLRLAMLSEGERPVGDGDASQPGR